MPIIGIILYFPILYTSIADRFLIGIVGSIAAILLISALIYNRGQIRTIWWAFLTIPILLNGMSILFSVGLIPSIFFIILASLIFYTWWRMC